MISYLVRMIVFVKPILGLILYVFFFFFKALTWKKKMCSIASVFSHLSETIPPASPQTFQTLAMAEEH